MLLGLRAALLGLTACLHFSRYFRSGRATGSTERPYQKESGNFECICFPHNHKAECLSSWILQGWCCSPCTICAVTNELVQRVMSLSGKTRFSRPASSSEVLTTLTMPSICLTSISWLSLNTARVSCLKPASQNTRTSKKELH